MTIAHKCPVCNHTTLTIDVTNAATVVFKDDDHDVINLTDEAAWEVDAYTQCENCCHNGPLTEFV